jgi:hypothetical protein
MSCNVLQKLQDEIPFGDGLVPGMSRLMLKSAKRASLT